MAARIVLFGATGYTGRLVAEALVEHGRRPVLAARSHERLERLAAELGGLETAIADVADPPSVRALVERNDVLISTVGPFTRWGDPAVEAAVDAGAHYLDSTGEAAFIRRVFERAPRSTLITAFGYDFVPGNLAAALALREAGEQATRVTVGYFALGGSLGLSGGTRASAAGITLEPAHSWHDGRLVAERGAKRVRSFDVEGRRIDAISIGASEQLALPSSYPLLRDVDVYLGWFGPLSRPLQALAAATSVATRVPGVKPAIETALRRVVKGSSGGPDAEQRSRTRAHVVAIAEDDRGAPLAEVRVGGADPYGFTGKVIAWGSERAADGELRDSGALGPVDAFGLDELERGCAGAGVARLH